MDDHFELMELMGECWAGHEGFRRCGFTPDQILVYCGIVESLSPTENYLAAVLSVDGKNFVYIAGHVPGELTPEQVLDEWNTFVTDELPTLPEPTLIGFWQKSCVGRSEAAFSQMLVGLLLKGFEIPELPASPEERAALIERAKGAF